MFTHLHVRSWFSFLAGGSSPRALVNQASSLGMTSLALTDVNGVYGIVRFQKACQLAGIHPVVGAEIIVEGYPLVLLCKNQEGYGNLNRLLTEIHLKNREEPIADLESLSTCSAELICLTGGRHGRLWQYLSQQRMAAAGAWLSTLQEIFADNLNVELCHGLLPDDSSIITRAYTLAQNKGLPVVATNDVRFATAADYRRYDLLTCIRLGITVSDPHGERPKNAEAYLKSADQLTKLIPYPEAFEQSDLIAQSCQLNLVPDYITPPAATVPPGEKAAAYLRRLSEQSLERMYIQEEREAARLQLEKELTVICSLELEEFFLVVREVVEQARERGIRCAGRGSAANSIVSYLLGITAVDPIRHNLLFERFLHGGRKGTPDIDVDFDSDRRDEIIAWMEERFGIGQTAMTATLITCRLRLALREVAKALGWPLSIVDKLSQKVPSLEVTQVREYRKQIADVLGESPLLELLLDLVENLEGCPRHLGLHSGGMVLSRVHLSNFSPVQVSANGVKVVQFDKDDVEAMGLVKLDVLGLRMLACLSEAVELVGRHKHRHIDLNALPLDDAKVFDLVCSGETMALFQIESQGQMHLIAKNQPETFDDLLIEIALFRPGPLQGGMVHPYIRRRRGEEEVVYDHPDLEPLLRDTYGVILFQEQVLEVAHQFAGLSLAAADDFRVLMSKFHDPEKMEVMRQRFVSGAMSRGVGETAANTVFDRVSKFVGYGFCRSHAAAFAKTVYQSAWMKCYYPAAYMAAFMQHRPGMYNLMTLEEEARRLSVPILLPSINESGTRFDLVKLSDGRLAIRKPLTSVVGLSEEAAQQIVWARMKGPFRNAEDFIRRLALPRDTVDSLARSGALDVLCGSSRKALWEVGVLSRRLESSRQQSQRTLFDLPGITPEDVPELPELTAAERLSWDYQTHGAGRLHPITLARRALDDLAIQSIKTIHRLVPLSEKPAKGPLVTIAGVVIVRQRPPTAKGFMFVTVEDETGFIQCVVNPGIQDALYDIMIGPAMIVRGQLQATGNWRGIIVKDAWPLEGIFGGSSGFPGSRGQDRPTTAVEEAA